MIAIAASDLSGHELIGLGVKVMRSSNRLHMGIEGIVVDETKNMLVIASGSEKKHLPKDNVTYGFTLPDGTFVMVDGEQLLDRPVDRTGKRFVRRRL